MDNKETLNLFPQPVFKYKVNNFKEYNEKLSEYIYNLKREDKEGEIDRLKILKKKALNAIEIGIFFPLVFIRRGKIITLLK